MDNVDQVRSDSAHQRGTEGALRLGGWDEGGKAGFPGYRLFRPYGTASVAGSIQALTRKCISLSAFE
jgi:hypothetical protein